MQFEPLPEDHYDEAVAFLASIFLDSAGAPFLRRDVRHWMYYAPHPYWEGPRCYVLRDAQGLLAHCGLCPMQYETADGVKSSFVLLDWAGSRRRPGAGFLLFRELWAKADTYMALGGTDDARKINRSIKTLRPVGEMPYMAHPLRPFGQMTASPWTWKSPGKWARSWKWKMARPKLNLREWKAMPVDRLNDSDAPLLKPAVDGGYTALRRTPELVNYWLACPIAKVRAWRLEHRGAAVGVLAISFVAKEARITDLVVNTASAPLAEAYSLAMELAHRNGEACEVRGASSNPRAVDAMAQAGMIPRGGEEIALGDPRNVFPQNVVLETNLSNGDGYFRHGKRPYFFTFG